MDTGGGAGQKGKRTRRHGQQRAECWGGGLIWGLNGKGEKRKKNHIQLEF